mmetsp:Transcript_18190/g.18241  ORF Transcript_18190/g.18241 Transcript_18190/m.18241 type:complete len:291 (+) Transcript_18190:43-915(+)
MVRLLINLDDFHKENTTEDIVATFLAVFALLWVIQGISFVLYTLLSGLIKVFGPYGNRVILARHTMDVIAMTSFSLMGLEVMNEFGGFLSFEKYIDPTSGEVATSTQRVYYYSSAASRLIVTQLAYELKNFCDSAIHNDGIIFLIHHAATALLATCGFAPFLHFYSSFFFGISEISTAILCALVCFDDERGIPALAKAFPTVMKILGVAFAISFIGFRVVLWPWVSYYFWIDCLAVLNDGSVHSPPVVYLFLVANVFLTSLQILWLGEIFKTAGKILFGEDKAKNEKKKK